MSDDLLSLYRAGCIAAGHAKARAESAVIIGRWSTAGAWYALAHDFLGGAEHYAAGLARAEREQRAWEARR